MNPLLSRTVQVALTGGIGSGKSAAGTAFEELGVPVIDSDAIAHHITAPQGLAIDQIQESFGAQYITPEGALDRSRMRALVFQDPSARTKLEAITHPLIRAQSEAHAVAALTKNPPYIIFMIPLLFESTGWQQRFHKIIVVDCSVDLQIERVMLRNHLLQEEVERIIATQAPRALRLQYADYVINNHGTTDELVAQVLTIHQNILLFEKYS